MVKGSLSMSYSIIFFTLAGVLIVIRALYVVVAVKKQRVESDWVPEHARLPYVTIEGDRVRIQNLRNFTWKAKRGVPSYIDRDFLLSNIIGVEFIVSQFFSHRLLKFLAHTYVNFHMAEGNDVSISVEARRLQGQRYNALAGLVGQYAFMYAITTYEDAMTYRHDAVVYKYPTTATPKQAQALFASMAESANALHTKPRAYNLITRNCTNSLVRDARRLPNMRIPIRHASFAPGCVAKVLYNLGFIAGEGTFRETREKYVITH